MSGPETRLVDRLLASLAGDAPVRALLVGAHLTAVCSRGCGLASTLAQAGPQGEGAIAEAGRLHRRSARELAGLARSANVLEAAIGVAAINSLVAVEESRALEVNARELLLARGRGKNVALVGHFPFIPELRQGARQLRVIERQPIEGEHPAEAAPELIPRADVVAITGSALVNHTLDDLLALCPRHALVVVLGPSTPLSPLLFEHGATIVSGAEVTDEAAVLRTVGQGATFRQVEGVRLLTLTREEAEP